MVSKNEDNLMINTRLMKITGLYHLLDSRSPKIFGHNVFKCLSIVQMSILLVTMIIYILNIYYFSDDINTVMQYLVFFTSDGISIFKIYCTIVNSNAIWNCIQMTSIEDLSYKYHDRRILKEMFHKILEEAQAGDQLGALIKGTKRDDLRRGMVLAKPGTVKMQDFVSTQVYVLNKEEGGNGKPLVPFQQLQMYSKTWDCACQLNIVGKEMVMPGEDCSVELKMIRPMVLEKGQRFTLRVAGATIGTGVITEIKKRLLDDERRGLLEGKKAREKKNAE